MVNDMHGAFETPGEGGQEPAVKSGLVSRWMSAVSRDIAWMGITLERYV